MKTDPEAITDLDPPGWLSGDAKDEWVRVMPILSKRRILTAADVGSLENFCVAMGQVREMERVLQEKGAVYQAGDMLKRNPAASIQADAMNRARLLAAELGLTPVSRSRPAIRDDAAPEEDDPLSLGGLFGWQGGLGGAVQ
ncbi:phage terminase small subunit P27 family [Celeribacter indicus]